MLKLIRNDPREAAIRIADKIETVLCHLFVENGHERVLLQFHRLWLYFLP